MALFPTFDDDELEEFVPDDSLDQDEELQPPVPYGTTWRFDFDNGDIMLDSLGSTSNASGLDTVKEWIQHTLLTRRFESPLYGPDTGTLIPDLIGSRDSTLAIEIIRKEVVAALLVHDRIVEASVPEIFPVGDTMYVYVDYVTDDSEQEGILLSLS